MNIFYNNTERRFRATFRFLLFIFVGFLFLLPSGFAKSTWLSAILLVIGSFLTIFILAKTIDQRPFSSFGFSFDTLWFKEFSLGVLMAFVAQTFIFGIEFMLGWIKVTGYGWQTAGIESWGWSFFTYFILMLCVGFYEEILFRSYPVRNFAEGFIFKNITPKTSAIIAIIITSSIFGIAHAANPEASLVSTVYIIFAGLMLGLPFLLTGRVALSIGIHFSWNWVMGGIYGFPVSGLEGRRSVLQTIETGPDLWTGGKFGPEAGFLGLIGMCIILFWILAYSRKMNEGKIQLDQSFKQDFKPLENQL